MGVPGGPHGGSTPRSITDVATCNKGTGTSQRVARERHWPAHDQGTGIGEPAIREQAQVACDQGLKLASAGLENGIGGLELASSQSGNWNWLAHTWRTELATNVDRGTTARGWHNSERHI